MAEAPTMTAKQGFWQRLGSLGGRTVIVLLVLALLVAAADRSGLLADWSSDRRFTLSPRLTTLLAQQQEPVELVGLWGLDQREALAPLEAMLARMATVNPKVTWRRLDPELQKPLLTAFQTRFRDAEPGNLYVTRGERAFVIGISPYTRLILQREVGGALVTLGEPNLPPAYLLQGHGELRANGGSEHGGDHLAHTLALAGFQVSVLDGTRTQAPSPAGLVVVAGATNALGERDLKLLSQHLQDGGGMVILADDRTPDDLTRWLRRHGVFLGAVTTPDPGSEAGNPSRILVSLRHHFVGQEAAFPHHNLLLDGQQINPQHPATLPLVAGGVPLLSPWSSPVFVVQPDPQRAETAPLIQRYRELGTQPFLGVPLLGTVGGDAFDKPRAAALEAPADLAERPPTPLAWAIEYQPASDSVQANVGGRLVVWGSRHGASDGVLAQANFANDQLLRLAATWAARRSAASDIPEAEIAAFQVEASDTALFWIMAVMLALIPCLFFGAGMLTWWDRR